jgi:hypothetical protein
VIFFLVHRFARTFFQSAFAQLFKKVLPDCDLLDKSMANFKSVTLWMGPAGTHTPLHHDRKSNLFAQVFGCKRIMMGNPFLLPKLKNDFGCYSPLTLDAEPGYALAREFGISGQPVLLALGECLFVPVGWWHEVCSIEPSVTITYDNFNLEPSLGMWDGVYWIRHCVSLQKPDPGE